jgi:protein involved in polysaccharide export with SLBB domain
MIARALTTLIFSAAALIFLVGCRAFIHGPKFDPRKDDAQSLAQVSMTNTLDSALLKPTTNEFRLGPGDMLEVEVVGRTETMTPALVGPDGKIYFDLLPGLNVWGLTLRQTRDLIERGMAEYVKHPRVSVTLREVRSSRIWVLGRINTPGVYSLNMPTTLLEAIARAGGLFTSAFTGTTEELADLKHSFVMRRGQFLAVNFEKLLYEGDTTQNIYLEPDDFVFIPSATSMEVFILGAVRQPRAVAFKEQVTLSSAIATAGGILPSGFAREVVIVRGSLTEPRFAVVNLMDILKGKAGEVRLQPGDIIYVPDQPLQSLRKAGYMILQTFVRTLAANEGLRAGGSVEKAGVNIPVNQ